MTAYYNEHDPHAAAGLRNLISMGVIAPGVVDERDIRDVVPSELSAFRQCHFFAGIGVWSYALRLARWPDDRPVWTGSCPCQPFSSAGKGVGFADERHLWPAWEWLIMQCRPDTIFGEQVASKDGLSWFDLVRTDLEGQDYAVGVSDTSAAGVGAPHIRQRLFFVANTERTRDGDARSGSAGSAASGMQGEDRQRERLRTDAWEPSALCGMADAQGVRLLRRQDDRDGGQRERASGQGREAGELVHVERAGREGYCGHGADGNQPRWPGALADGSIAETGASLRPGPTNGFWRDADWFGCTDGKWRPVEPSTFPLVDGAAFRVGSGSPFEGKSRAKMLKGYGNAIVAPLAAEFIRAYMESENLSPAA